VRIARKVRWTVLLAGVFLAVVAPRISAQNPDTLMPEESAKKAHALLEEMIAKLGGPAYLSVRDSVCNARLSQFGNNGDLSGYEVITDFWKLPDKNRTEYFKKKNIIELFNGNQGWTMDRGGVQEQPESAVEDFQEQIKGDLDNLLRFRLHEEGMSFRFGGSDVVDLRQVDWVEIVDRDRRTFRIAIDRLLHLPVRSFVITRNPVTRERTQEVTTYSNFHPQDGVETPFQLARERDGRKIFQAFFSDCKYNSGLTDDMFTRASLEKRFSEIGKKDKKKKDKS
jgi:hypothetical protein